MCIVLAFTIKAEIKSVMPCLPIFSTASSSSLHVCPQNTQYGLPFPLCRTREPSCPNGSRAPTGAARPTAQRSRQTSLRPQRTEGKEHPTRTGDDEECAREQCWGWEWGVSCV